MMYESLQLNFRFRTLPKIKIVYRLSRQTSSGSKMYEKYSDSIRGTYHMQTN